MPGSLTCWRLHSSWCRSASYTGRSTECGFGAGRKRGRRRHSSEKPSGDPDGFFMPAAHSTRSKAEFDRKLHEPGRCGADDLSEMGVIIHLPIYRRRPVELGMVEHVECLKPKFKRFRFGYSQQFCQRHIKVIDSGATEKSPRHIPQLTERLRGKG